MQHYLTKEKLEELKKEAEHLKKMFEMKLPSVLNALKNMAICRKMPNIQKLKKSNRALKAVFLN